MTELINSLKIFASGTSSGTDATKTHARSVPLMTLGRADSCSESGFNQWRDAMRMVARLPGGLPAEFRISLWENLADRYLYQHGLEWARVVAKSRAYESNRDEDIADQIDKDLHRTGCTGFSGAKQAVLKRVLVAYARWNPAVGYCQGFNMIGAMLLQMTSGNEQLTLKIFVFLIEGVTGTGYFSQGLRGLAVDMAVFREILKLRKPTLNSHLSALQKGDDHNNPPLTDVFTMHWFLTLFIHCLPTPSVLRIWDLVLLEGSEVLLRAALVMWAAIETRVLCVSSADEFYSVMGVVTREMLEFGLMDPNSLVKCIVSVGPFPFPGLEELRQKHRAIISKDTPHKSFFLAKRELDNLKRHYSSWPNAAIRHRQKATTIILRGLDSSCRTSGAKAVQTRFNNFSNKNPNNLPNKKPAPLSPKPKPRRTNSGGKSVILLHNNKNNVGNYGNRQDSFNRNVNTNHNNHHVNSGSNVRTVKGHQQVTVPWDRNTKKPKNFRKRSTSAASSHSSSSSSSTELCDSLSDMENDEDDSVWTDADSKSTTGNSNSNKPKSALIVNETGGVVDKSEENLNANDNSRGRENNPPPRTLPVKSTSPGGDGTLMKIQVPEIIETEIKDEKEEQSQVEQEKEDKEKTSNINNDFDEDSSEVMMMGDMDGAKCIDTNDSQHFLEEMTRLGKSDSFYENLSKRICELQFQNLKILTTCNTIPEPVVYSPLPSPMSPFPPTNPPTPPNSTNNKSMNLSVPFTQAKLVLSPSLNHLSLSTSPRASVCSSTPGSPLVSSPVPSDFPGVNSNNGTLSKNCSRRTSKSSISSVEQLAEDKLFIDNVNFVPKSASSQSIISNSSGGDGGGDVNPNLSCLRENSLATIPPTNENFIIPSIGEAQQSLQVRVDETFEKISDHPGEDIQEEDEMAQDRNSGGAATEDINAVIRENIAILQRLKLKPAAYDNEDDIDDTSPSSVSEFSDSDGGGALDMLDLDYSSSSTNIPSRASSITLTAVTTAASRRRSLSRCGSSGSASGTSGRLSSVSRTTSVCLNCSRTKKASKALMTNQGQSSVKSKPKKNFNPFPTARKARVRTTKFGLYT